jgi:hypothetical protein
MHHCRFSQTHEVAVIAKRLATAFLLLSPMGCATITQGSTDTVTVDTRPPGATCELKRDGQVVAYVNPTPGSIQVSKSKDNIAVRCEKDGYQPAVGNIGSEFQAMTFGNVLFGGLIGVAVDAASGAMNEYQPLVTITLVPDEFETPRERDRFYDDLREEFEQQYDDTIARIRRKCGQDRAECDRQLKLAEQRREERLAEIERQRRTASVAS